jgi:hypothetical protein
MAPYCEVMGASARTPSVFPLEGRFALMPGSDVQCSLCGREFEKDEPVACISGRIMGDECTDSYYWCEACNVYIIRLCRDVFVGPEAARNSEPIPREEGERRLKLIRTCKEPHDARCRCDGHREYFGGWLD